MRTTPRTSCGCWSVRTVRGCSLTNSPLLSTCWPTLGYVRVLASLYLCAKSFKTSCNLTDHLANVHDPAETGLEKKLKCKFCGKSFRYRAHLTQHERVHTKEKPFQCEFCEKQFSVKCNLKIHLEIHKDPDQRLFKCNLVSALMKKQVVILSFQRNLVHWFLTQKFD